MPALGVPAVPRGPRGRSTPSRGNTVAWGSAPRTGPCRHGCANSVAGPAKEQVTGKQRARAVENSGARPKTKASLPGAMGSPAQPEKEGGRLRASEESAQRKGGPGPPFPVPHAGRLFARRLSRGLQDPCPQGPWVRPRVPFPRDLEAQHTLPPPGGWGGPQGPDPTGQVSVQPVYRCSGKREVTLSPTCDTHSPGLGETPTPAPGTSLRRPQRLGERPRRPRGARGPACEVQLCPCCVLDPSVSHLESGTRAYPPQRAACGSDEHTILNGQRGYRNPPREPSSVRRGRRPGRGRASPPSVPTYPVGGWPPTPASSFGAGVFHAGSVAQRGPGLDKNVCRAQLSLRDQPLPGGALTHQDVAVSFSELSEGLGDLLPRFGLLEVSVHGAVFFLRTIRAPEGSGTDPARQQLSGAVEAPRCPRAVRGDPRLHCQAQGVVGRHRGACPEPRLRTRRVASVCQAEEGGQGRPGGCGPGLEEGAAGSRGWRRHICLGFPRGLALGTPMSAPRVPAIRGRPPSPDRREVLPPQVQ